MKKAGFAATIALVLTACDPDANPGRGDAGQAAARTPAVVANGPGPEFAVGAGESYPALEGESHLGPVRQLTFQGENAEAYFSFDGTRLVYQRTPAEGGCDQIYELDLATGRERLVSTGEGRTTCSYFYPDGERILFSSTHLAGAACPAPVDYSRGYVWPVYEAYDIFLTDAAGGLTRLTDTPGYDAEATVSPLGDRVVFTSVRDGDLDLYSMALDGTDVRRLTERPGYDGGAFYSPDGSKIVWRAHYPEEGAELEDYRSLLAEGLIRPSRLELWIADADGGNPRQLTDNGAANFGPYWHPSGSWIVFSSNVHDPQGRDFDLYGIDVNGGEPWRITYAGGFDGFPVFSPDGRFLVWGSNRNPAHEGNTNVFIAEWVD
jgi:Tol biopolymer transport system component